MRGSSEENCPRFAGGGCAVCLGHRRTQEMPHSADFADAPSNGTGQHASQLVNGTVGPGTLISNLKGSLVDFIHVIAEALSQRDNLRMSMHLGEIHPSPRLPSEIVDPFRRGLVPGRSIRHV